MKKILSQKHKWHRITDTVWSLGIPYGVRAVKVAATIVKEDETTYFWDIVNIPFLEGKTETLQGALSAVNYMFTDEVPEGIIDIREVKDGRS